MYTSPSFSANQIGYILNTQTGNSGTFSINSSGYSVAPLNNNPPTTFSINAGIWLVYSTIYTYSNVKSYSQTWINNTTNTFGGVAGRLQTCIQIAVGLTQTNCTYSDVLTINSTNNYYLGFQIATDTSTPGTLNTGGCLVILTRIA